MQIFLPYAEILWKKIPASLEEIRAYGFDGAECHLIGKLLSKSYIDNLQKVAREFRLDIRFHQGWSWKTGQPNIYNLILCFLGALVSEDIPLLDQVKNVGTSPVVIYGNLVDQPGKINFLYQTARLANSTLSFREFVDVVKKRNLPVVFDTQHVLEWSQDVHGVEGLPNQKEKIRDLVLDLWQELRHQVTEIHLCDFDPKLGRSRGRNVFPGKGIFPLSDFCTAVRESGWNGIVVPEVVMHSSEVKDLKKLREKIDQLFEF